MMKKLLMMILCFTTAINTFGQAIEGDVLYVYRNDNQINGFLRSDIDSITYSCIDTDSILHQQYVTQEIYTIDSIYRIPLSVIDSVSWYTPPTEYQSGVINISDQLMPYVVSCDSLTINLLASTPATLLPSVGRKLVTLEMNEIFPSGFLGEVVSVNSSNEGYSIECTLASIGEVFKTYYSVSSTYGYQVPDESTNAASRRISWYEDPLNWGIDQPINIPRISFNANRELSLQLGAESDLSLTYESKAEIGITPSFHIVSTLIVRNGDVSFNGSITGKITLDEELAFSGGLSWSREYPWEKLRWQKPIPGVPLVNFYIQPGHFFNAALKGSLSAKWTQSFTFGASFSYNNKGQNAIKPKIGGRVADATFSLEGSINGSIATGLFLETGLNIGCREISKACFRGELGVEFEGDYMITNNDIANASTDTKAYERLKNSHLESHVFGDLKAESSVLIVNSSTELLSDTWTPPLKIFGKWDLVPSFSNVSLVQCLSPRTSADAQIEAQGNCLFPVRVGMSIRDNSNNEKQSVISSSDYPNTVKRYTYTFNDLGSNIDDYTLYPMVKMLGVNMLASPSSKMETTEFPVEITDFNQTSSEFSRDGFNYEGTLYPYKYGCSVDVILKNQNDVEDWGYVYKDPYGKIAHISLKSFTSPYTDTRYSYYRNSNQSEVTLYEYFKSKKTGDYYYSEPKSYELKHSDESIKVTTVGSSHVSTTREKLIGQIQDYDETMPTIEAAGFLIMIDGEEECFGRLRKLDSQGLFSVEVPYLKVNTTYTYRAYVETYEYISGMNIWNKYYGDSKTFTTEDHPQEIYDLIEKYSNEEAEYCAKLADAYSTYRTIQANYIELSYDCTLVAQLYEKVAKLVNNPSTYTQRANELRNLAQTYENTANSFISIENDIDNFMNKLDMDVANAVDACYTDDDYETLKQSYNDFDSNDKPRVISICNQANADMETWINLMNQLNAEWDSISNLYDELRKNK